MSHKTSPVEVPPVIDEVEKVEFRRIWPTAPSLKPGIQMIEAAADKQPQAVAIREAWRFRHPVRVISREAYQELFERSSGIVYGGE